MAQLHPSFSFLILISIVLTTSLLSRSALGQQDIPCRLVWSRWMTGEEIPENAVATEKDQFYIGRIGDVVGLIDKKSQSAQFNLNLNQTLGRALNCEILINPNDCAISWPEAIAGVVGEPDFAVQISNGRFVGAGRDHQLLIPGYTVPSQFWTYYAVDGALHTTGMGSWLRSAVNLRVTIDNYEFHKVVEVEEPDFMGFDYIENNSPVTVEHTIIHRRSVTKIYDYTETKSYAQATTFTVDCSIGIPEVFSLNIHFNHTETSEFGSRTNLRNETEEEVTSQRTILVPPYEVIEACSTITTANQREIPYTATATYVAQGLSAVEVKSILLSRGYDQSDVIGSQGDRVMVKISGAMNMNTPLKTKFIVNTAGDPEGCMQMSKKVRQKRRHLV